jgi:nanoRNase/pAp phosphatase (c-di-AMP/oligoRNAs hydrolase)
LGRGILDYIEQNVQRTIKEAQTGYLSINEKCYRIALVNASWNHSEIGNALAKNADIGMVWCEHMHGTMRFSLRSLGEIDVSEIAKIFGGGGHKNASGFTIPMEFGRFIIDQIRSKEGLEFVEGGTRQNYPEQDSN